MSTLDILHAVVEAYPLMETLYYDDDILAFNDDTYHYRALLEGYGSLLQIARRDTFDRWGNSVLYYSGVLPESENDLRHLQLWLAGSSPGRGGLNEEDMDELDITELMRVLWSS